MNNFVARCVIVAFLVLLVVPATVSAQGADPSLNDVTTYLILTATNGTLEPQADGTYLLTLAGLPDHLINIGTATDFSVVRVPLDVLVPWANAGTDLASIPAKLDLGHMLIDLAVTPLGYDANAASATFAVTINAVLDPIVEQSKAEAPAAFEAANLVFQIDPAAAVTLAATPNDEGVRGTQYSCAWWCHLTAGQGGWAAKESCGCCFWVRAFSTPEWVASHCAG